MTEFPQGRNPISHAFPFIPKGLEATVVDAETAREALRSGVASCAMKLYGQPTSATPFLLLGQPKGEALAFARSWKEFYTMVTNEKGVGPAAFLRI